MVETHAMLSESYSYSYLCSCLFLKTHIKKIKHYADFKLLWYSGQRCQREMMLLAFRDLFLDMALQLTVIT